jgi:predicted GIY-YIG superfamily endonuclease
MEKNNVMWFCYILKNIHNGRTYNGSTNNPVRRLRQHNGEISGGAKATSRTKGGWIYIMLLSGFSDHINTLSCEWRIKCPSGKPGKRETKYEGPAGRIESLNCILPLDYWTKQCIICNRDFKMKLHIREDMVPYLNTEIVPENIEAITVSNIDKEYIETNMELKKEIYD